MLTPATAPVFVARAVFADYGGDAPDTCDQVVVADEEIAKTLCDLLNDMLANGHTACQWEGLWYQDPDTTLVEGYESSKSYQHREDLAYAKDIALTVADALAHLSDNEPTTEPPEGWDDEDDEDE